MINFIIFLFILGILIIVHEFGHFIAAKKLKVKVEKFSLGLGPLVLSKKKNDTEYCLSAIPLGGYVKLAGDNLEEFKGNPDEYLARPPRHRFLIILFGPVLNYVLGFLCFWLVFSLGYSALTARVGKLKDGFGAKEAGIQVGDKIIAVEGRKVEVWEDLSKSIQANKEKGKVLISLLRDNQEHIFEVKIKEESVEDILGQKRKVGLIGIEASNETVKIRPGAVKAFFLSAHKTYELTVIIYKTLWFIIAGKLPLGKSLTGIVGIYHQTSEVIKLGIDALLYWTALLNISLAVFNLLPLPVLDGGHILLLAIEKIRGRSLSIKTEQVITRLGVTLLISLVLLVTYNDLVRFYGDKIYKFLIRR